MIVEMFLIFAGVCALALLAALAGRVLLGGGKK